MYERSAEIFPAIGNLEIISRQKVRTEQELIVTQLAVLQGYKSTVTIISSQKQKGKKQRQNKEKESQTRLVCASY